MINDEYKLGVLLNQKLRVQFLLTFLGEGGGKSKKLRLRGREGSIESQLKCDFFSYDGMP